MQHTNSSAPSVGDDQRAALGLQTVTVSGAQARVTPGHDGSGRTLTGPVGVSAVVGRSGAPLGRSCRRATGPRRRHRPSAATHDRSLRRVCGAGGVSLVCPAAGGVDRRCALRALGRPPAPPPPRCAGGGRWTTPSLVGHVGDTVLTQTSQCFESRGCGENAANELTLTQVVR